MSGTVLRPDRGLALRSAIGSTVVFALLAGLINRLGGSLGLSGFAVMVGLYLIAMIGFALLIEARRHWQLHPGRIIAANGTEFPLRPDTEIRTRWGMVILRNPGGARLSLRNLPDPDMAARQIAAQTREPAA